MQSFIITKWIEPYKLLEKIKEYYDYKDFTFNGLNKDVQKNKFLKELNNSQNYVGLYMKNVNKFYLFIREDYFDIIATLKEFFELAAADYTETQDVNVPFDMIDMGRAEASIFF